MSDAYNQLLDATIQHLEGLKSRGARYVSVTPETLRALAQPVFRVATAPETQSIGIEEPQKIETASVVAQPAAVANPQPAPLVFVPAETRATVPALDPKAKAAAFATLRERVAVCVKCPNLASSRKNTVFGVGNIDAQLMFVGEAPGADEDTQGEPFVGRAGELLTKIIQATGLGRKDVYIANILKCRPDTPGQRTGNRKPTPEEMTTCIPYLHEQIDLIRPRVIVALGGTALEGLLGKTVGITRLRGQWQTYRDMPMMPTFHPSFLLHNQAMSEKRKVWEDMLAVMEKLEMPISDKQRNYFLRA